MIKKILIALATVVMVAGASSTALAERHYPTNNVNVDEKEKVTICHRHNSVTNPYNKETVDADAADGNGQNDHSHHTGPVATSEEVAQALKDSKTKWGDIIPPHDDYAGLNWTTEGQAVYNNDCKYVTPPVTPPTPPTPPVTNGTTTTTTGVVLGSQVTATPAQGVNAGGGGAAGSSLTSLVALAGSVASFGYGAFRLRKFNV